MIGCIAKRMYSYCCIVNVFNWVMLLAKHNQEVTKVLGSVILLIDNLLVLN